MTTPGIHNCNECGNFAWKKGNPPPNRNKFSDWATCAKGHTPRYIKPKPYNFEAPWGFRRRCADFVGNNRVCVRQPEENNNGK